MLDAESRALRWFLAALCLIAPFFFGVVVMQSLTTKIVGFEVEKIQWAPPILAAQANPAAPTSAKSPSGEDLTMLPLTRQFAGRQNFASVSGLHFVSCGATLGIALYVLSRRVKRYYVLGGLIIVALALTIMTYRNNLGEEKVQEKFVQAVVRAADLKVPVFACPADPAIPDESCVSAFGQAPLFSSNGLLEVVHANKLIGIFAAFLALFALFVVSLPPEHSSSAWLHEAASQLRLLLFSTSAVFVTSNLASKA